MGTNFNVEKFYEGLDVIFKRYEYSQVEPYIRSFLESAIRTKDQGAMVVGSNELGGYLRAAGRLEEAKELYKQILENIKNMGMENTKPHAVILINGGNVFLADKDYKTALSYFNLAKNILNATGIDKNYETAALFNNMSVGYREMGMLFEGEEFAKKALDIIGEYPNQRLELATTLVNLGTVQIRKGEYIKAEANLSQAITIYESESKGKDIHYANALAAMGELYYNMGEYWKSEEYYTDAMMLVEDRFGKNMYYDLLHTNYEKVIEKRK